MTTIKMMVMTTTRTIISTTAITTTRTIIPITVTIIKTTATMQITALQTKRTVPPKQQAVQQILQPMEKQQPLQAKLPQPEQVLLPTTSPKTGDDTNVMIWIALLAVSCTT